MKCTQNQRKTHPSVSIDNLEEGAQPGDIRKQLRTLGEVTRHSRVVFRFHRAIKNKPRIRENKSEVYFTDSLE